VERCRRTRCRRVRRRRGAPRAHRFPAGRWVRRPTATAHHTVAPTRRRRRGRRERARRRLSTDSAREPPARTRRAACPPGWSRRALPRRSRPPGGITPNLRVLIYAVVVIAIVLPYGRMLRAHSPAEARLLTGGGGGRSNPVEGLPAPQVTVKLARSRSRTVPPDSAVTMTR